MASTFVTVAQMQTRIRALLGDVGTNKAFTNDQIEEVLNEAYPEWRQSNDPIVDYLEYHLNEDGFDDMNPWFTGSFTFGGIADYSNWVKTIDEFVSVHSGTSIISVPLEYVPPAEIYAMSSESTTAATPKYWSIETISGDTFRVYLYPPVLLGSAPRSVSIVFRPKASVLTDSTHVLKIYNDHAYMLARVCAAKLAHLANRPQVLIDDLLRGVPEQMRAIATAVTA